MVSEIGVRDTAAGYSGPLVRSRAAARLQNVSARLAAVILFGLAAVSAAIRVYLTREVHGPFVFLDELGYERMAYAFAHTGHFALFGKSGLSYSPLYPVLLSPIYALTSSAQTAYEWAKALNAVLLSLSVFPVYAVARFVLDRPRALGVAALSLLAPLMFYADFEMSESLAYPLFLVAIWALLRAMRAPSARNDLLLLVAIALASAARIQQVALVPAALTAIVLVAAIRPDDRSGGRAASVARSVARHRLLFGATALGLAAVLVARAAAGGRIPLAGRYSVVGTRHPSPLDVIELAFRHLAGLDLALGIVPFAGALLAAYALVRLGFPERALVFGAVAASATAWLLLEVAFDAAAFDTGTAHAGGLQTGGDLPRIHERYLIYLVPLFLIALVAAIRAVRPRVGTIPHLTIALSAALLPGTIPFTKVINYSVVVDSFGLQPFALIDHGRFAAIPNARLVALAVGGALALTYLYALLRPRPSFAVVMTVICFVILAPFARGRIASTADRYRATAGHSSWVDRTAPSRDVALVGGHGTRAAVLQLTAFDNLKISRVYYLCSPALESAFGEQRLTVSGSGMLETAAGPLRARYAVVPDSLGVRGRVLARRGRSRLALVAPAGAVLRMRGAGPCTS